MTEFGDAGMLVIDPVGNHMAGKNSDSSEDVRAAIGPLNQLADDFEAMVFGVRHLSEKDASRGALATILGSSAWVQIPRVVLAVVRDDEDPAVSHVQVIAGNRLPAGSTGRMFRIEGVLLEGLDEEVTHAVWLGESTKDINSMLMPSQEKEPSSSKAARELILDELEQATRIESDTLDARIAEATGLTVKTVRNLRGQLADAGLIRATPDKDEDGTVLRWWVLRTNAPRES